MGFLKGIGKAFKSVASGIGNIGKGLLGVAGKAIAVANPLGSFFSGLGSMSGQLVSSAGSRSSASPSTSPSVNAAKGSSPEDRAEALFQQQKAFQMWTLEMNAKTNNSKTQHEGLMAVVRNFRS